MKIGLDWLNAYLDRPATLDEANRVLTDVGFPEDGVETVSLGDGATDICVDFEVTSNRGDCLSHVGLARELAAATDRQLVAPPIPDSPPETPPEIPPEAAPARLQISPEDDSRGAVQVADEVAGGGGGCPVYTARVITGVTVAPSPDWLQKRLISVGLRPVNNVVDITNFVLMELGQPLHAFDLARLAGGQVQVRHARPGERFRAIDGSEHALDPSILVIADAKNAQAVAGVMGGADSQVTAQTTDILIESARFDPLAVRSASRRLKLASDASYRFERGVDPCGVDRASRRAAGLILELAGGTLAGPGVRVGETEPGPVELTMRVDRCNALLGLGLTAQAQAAYLAPLGLAPRVVGEGGEGVTVTVPSFRLDLTREVDLIEEVARHYGLDNVPVREKIAIVTHRRQDAAAARQKLDGVLIAHGFHETITPTFLPEDQARMFCPSGQDLMQVSRDRRKTDPYLRPSLLPSLLACRKLNQDRGNDGVWLYEVADTFARATGDQAMVEKTVLALLADAPDPSAALRSMRGSVEELIQALGGARAMDAWAVEPETAAHHDVAAAVMLGGRRIGRLGLLGSGAIKAFGLQTPVVVLEVEAAPLLGLYPPVTAGGGLPRYPGIERDLSVVVPEAVRWSQIDAAVQQVKPDRLESLDFVGVYRGKPIDAGYKSVSLRMTFRDPAKTLRHDAVDPQVQAVVQSLAQALGATLRT